MGLIAESKTLILNQGSPEQDIKIIVKKEVAEFRRANNDSLLLVMHKDECFALAQEFFPSLVLPSP